MQRHDDRYDDRQGDRRPRDACQSQATGRWRIVSTINIRRQGWISGHFARRA